MSSEEATHRGRREEQENVRMVEYNLWLKARNGEATGENEDDHQVQAQEFATYSLRRIEVDHSSAMCRSARQNVMFRQMHLTSDAVVGSPLHPPSPRRKSYRRPIRPSPPPALRSSPRAPLSSEGATNQAWVKSGITPKSPPLQNSEQRRSVNRIRYGREASNSRAPQSPRVVHVGGLDAMRESIQTRRRSRSLHSQFENGNKVDSNAREANRLKRFPSWKSDHGSLSGEANSSFSLDYEQPGPSQGSSAFNLGHDKQENEFNPNNDHDGSTVDSDSDKSHGDVDYESDYSPVVAGLQEPRDSPRKLYHTISGDITSQLRPTPPPPTTKKSLSKLRISPHAQRSSLRRRSSWSDKAYTGTIPHIDGGIGNSTRGRSQTPRFKQTAKLGSISRLSPAEPPPSTWTRATPSNQAKRPVPMSIPVLVPTPPPSPPVSSSPANANRLRFRRPLQEGQRSFPRTISEKTEK